MKASVIIAIYNKFDYLRLVLAGFEMQTEKEFEVILADDGSNAETVEKIREIASDLPFRINHLWQEDKGFRKNRMLNRAIMEAESDYIIFVDGDCIPHPEFVAEHVKHADEGVSLTGRRVNLSEKFTSKLSVENVTKGFLQNTSALVWDGIFGKSFDVEKGFYFKSDYIRQKLNNKKRGLLGCNFSATKNDLLKVNGFDERYEAPSVGEDSDIQFRFELEGIEIKSLNNIAVQYHLYHKLQPRPQINLDLFEEVKKSKLALTPFGINKDK